MRERIKYSFKTCHPCTFSYFLCKYYHHPHLSSIFCSFHHRGSPENPSKIPLSVCLYSALAEPPGSQQSSREKNNEKRWKIKKWGKSAFGVFTPTVHSGRSWIVLWCVSVSRAFSKVLGFVCDGEDEWKVLKVFSQVGVKQLMFGPHQTSAVSQPFHAVRGKLHWNDENHIKTHNQ